MSQTTDPIHSTDYTGPDSSADSDGFDGFDGVGLDLDLRVVETGPPAAALLCSTDDGCDTRKDGHC